MINIQLQVDPVLKTFRWSVIKSMLYDSHFVLGAGRICNKPADLAIEDLFLYTGKESIDYSSSQLHGLYQATI